MNKNNNKSCCGKKIKPTQKKIKKQKKYGKKKHY